MTRSFFCSVSLFLDCFFFPQVFGLSNQNLSFCLLHAKMRITEKFLKLLLNFSFPQVQSADSEWVERWKKRIRNWPHLSGFDVWQPKEKFGIKWKFAGLNGEQAESILVNYKEIESKWQADCLVWVEKLKQKGMFKDASELANKIKYMSIICFLYEYFVILETWSPTEQDFERANQLATHVRSYWILMFGESNFTPYLHLICSHGPEHLQKFFSFGALNGMSQQGKLFCALTTLCFTCNVFSHFILML